MFQPTYTDKTTGELKASGVWWIQFSRHGKPRRDSSKSLKESDAKKRLKKRLGEDQQRAVSFINAEAIHKRGTDAHAVFALRCRHLGY